MGSVVRICRAPRPQCACPKCGHRVSVTARDEDGEKVFYTVCGWHGTFPVPENKITDEMRRYYES